LKAAVPAAGVGPSNGQIPFALHGEPRRLVAGRGRDVVRAGARRGNIRQE
jgi:hypothetical protein